MKCIKHILLRHVLLTVIINIVLHLPNKMGGCSMRHYQSLSKSPAQQKRSFNRYSNNYSNNEDDVYILKPSDYPTNYISNRQHESSPTCGRKLRTVSQNIVGGTRTTLGKHPWMALLQYKTKNGIQNGCGGTLISPKYVLTAAHCADKTLLREKKFTLYQIVLGEYDTRHDPDCKNATSNVCADPIRTYTPLSIFIHEQFVRTIARHDIALIQLDRNVWFSDYVKPICLLSRNENNMFNKLVTIAGWGITGKGGTLNSPILLEASLPIMDNENCNCSGANLIPEQICLGFENGQSCLGDSGGPLMVEKMENLQLVSYQIGIISYGCSSVCGQTPSVNTYVPFYIDWIKSKIR